MQEVSDRVAKELGGSGDIADRLCAFAPKARRDYEFSYVAFAAKKLCDDESLRRVMAALNPLRTVPASAGGLYQELATSFAAENHWLQDPSDVSGSHLAEARRVIDAAIAGAQSLPQTKENRGGWVTSLDAAVGLGRLDLARRCFDAMDWAGFEHVSLIQPPWGEKVTTHYGEFEFAVVTDHAEGIARSASRAKNPFFAICAALMKGNAQGPVRAVQALRDSGLADPLEWVVNAEWIKADAARSTCCYAAGSEGLAAIARIAQEWRQGAMRDIAWPAVDARAKELVAKLAVHSPANYFAAWRTALREVSSAASATAT
ncbi:hypothetical protein Bcep1808_2102 [Burkholderia vietnamiensis G4]|uniref:Uncharacterized protein n=1 Tax=Burkholderia vietnamiensis (strain G4 / LMG 22486) TaxID=269482 RepID=A4JFQ1_BURVG|nr:hypothetical protein Bcep1808_2102 [Burkholderia vietnamiensis G4]